MITVPRSDNPVFSSGEKPSEAMLLAALAHMKDIGRIPVKDVPGVGGKPSVELDFPGQPGFRFGDDKTRQQELRESEDLSKPNARRLRQQEREMERQQKDTDNMNKLLKRPEGLRGKPDDEEI